MGHIIDKYFISESGDIINVNSGKILKSQSNGFGYRKITLTIKGIPIQRYVHRLVAESYIPNPKGLPQVNHVNGNKSDNRAQNLEWCDNRYNQIHAHRIGLKQNGNECWNGKFTESQIHEIKSLHAGGVLQYKIAQMFGVSKSTICDIVNGKRYKLTIK